MQKTFFLIQSLRMLHIKVGFKDKYEVLSYVCQELRAALTNSDAVEEGLGVLVGDALRPDVDVKGKTQAISSATNT